MRASEFADKVARRLHGLINKEREKRGLNPLRGRRPLIDAATEHSKVMARTGDIFHKGPDGTPQQRAPAGYSRIAENCAMNHGRGSTGKAAHKLLNQWMDSKPHRSNLLDSNNKYDGLGVWVDGGKIYATHMMARSESAFHKVGTRMPAVGQLIRKPVEFVNPPYTVRGRQTVYGLIFGAIAFFGSMLQYSLTYTTAAPDNVSRLLSYYLSTRPALFEQAGTNPGALLDYFIGIPTLMVAFSSVLCATVISNTGRLRYLFENTFSAGVGFTAVSAVMLWNETNRIQLQNIVPFAATALVGCSLACVGICLARRAPE